MSLFAASLNARSLAQQLILLVLATAFPLILLSIFMFNMLVANERNAIRQNLTVSAKTLAGLVDNEIDTHAALAATLALSPSLQESDFAAFRKEAERALAFVPGAWLTVSSPDGQLLLNTLVAEGTVLPKHVAPDVIQRAFAERRIQVGDLAFGPVTHRWVTYVEAPVFRDGLPLYSIELVLSPERFLHLLTTRFTHGEVVAIVDRNKKFVARVPDHEARVGTLASEGWRAGMARSPTGWVENKVLEGEWSVTGYAQSQYGWTAGIAQLESDINEPLNKIFWLSGLATVALTLLSLTLAVMIGRRATFGMTALTSVAQRLGDGRIVEVPPAPFAEALTIGETLARVSIELKRRGDLIASHQRKLEDTVARRTEELVAESKRHIETENTLRQVQKMDSIGQLTGGIAHDFNNMLTIIMGNLDTVQRRLKSLDNSATLNRPIEAALQGTRNAAKLTHRLLAFSRQQTLEPQAFNLNEVLTSMSDLLTRTVGESIRVEMISSAGLWTTFADINQIENSLINLAINARDAMPDGGKLIIETANAYLDDAYVNRFGDLKAGQYVMLGVSDTGTGIPPEILEKVFEPFYTTKEHGKGTGLGLAMVYGFVKQSLGHIRIYSETGRGTAVKIYLPRQHETAAAVHPRGVSVEEKPVSRANAGEVILLVEDDAGVREYATGVLEDLGYEILTACSGDEALQIISERRHVDLLFTDVVLGGTMTGKQLAEAIGKSYPSLPVLFTTGYTRNAIVHQGRVDEGVELLNKPYTQRDLASKVRALLDRKNSGGP